MYVPSHSKISLIITPLVRRTAAGMPYLVYEVRRDVHSEEGDNEVRDFWVDVGERVRDQLIAAVGTQVDFMLNELGEYA